MTEFTIKFKNPYLYEFWMDQRATDGYTVGEPHMFKTSNQRLAEDLVLILKSAKVDVTITPHPEGERRGFTYERSGRWDRT